jgi:hypothetical protein
VLVVGSGPGASTSVEMEALVDGGGRTEMTTDATLSSFVAHRFCRMRP